jgi:pantoate--beta-alanine ligase
VATVVMKLFNQVRPDVAVFGEKDYQQLAVIRTLVRDFDMNIEIIGHETVRETDGLALSSRNAYLSEAERALAPQLHQALQNMADTVRAGSTPSVSAIIENLIATGFAKVDYIALRDANTLGEPVAGQPQRILAAVWLGKTRLVDNIAV